MAIAETDPRKADTEGTSTGSNRDATESEDKKIIPGPTALQLNSISQHSRSYFKLKDFTFSMPGGLDDTSLGMFLDACNKYKDDFRHPCKPGDELKVWQKIVKKCCEKSDFPFTFNVNSVMELAQSLKAYINRNENRKDDETFKMLRAELADLLQYFPSDTSNSVSQNLRQRRKSSEVKTFASVSETAVTPRQSISAIDNLIIKYCQEFIPSLQQAKAGNKTNAVWGKIKDKILKYNGLTIDVRDHLKSFKRNVVKELKKEYDAQKRHNLFLDLVSDYQSVFDYIPPLTIKAEDFLLPADVNGFSPEEHSNEEMVIDEPTREIDEASAELPVEVAKNRRSSRKVEEVLAKKHCSDEDFDFVEDISLAARARAEDDSPQAPIPDSPLIPVPVTRRKRGRPKKQAPAFSPITEDTFYSHSVRLERDVTKSGRYGSRRGRRGRGRVGRPPRQEHHEELPLVELMEEEPQPKQVTRRVHLTKPMTQRKLEVQPSDEASEHKYSSSLAVGEPTPFVLGEAGTSRQTATEEVAAHANRLQQIEENSGKILQEYRNKIQDSSASKSLCQLIPSLQNPVELSTILPAPANNHPSWFHSFFSDYKKHEMWKMHQMLRMQQELVDMESKKLGVLEQILRAMNRNS